MLSHMYSQHTHSVESFSLPIRGKVKVFGARRTIHVNPLYERNLVKLSCSAQFLPNVFHGASQFVHSRKWICQKSNETLVPLETFYLFHLNICFFRVQVPGLREETIEFDGQPETVCAATEQTGAQRGTENNAIGNWLAAILFFFSSRFDLHRATLT